MQSTSQSRSDDVFDDYQDYQAFETQLTSKTGKKHNFDDQFLDFMNWFKNDIHSRYSKKDFQRIELRNLKILVFGFLGLIVAYTLLHTYYPQFALIWGIPLFIASLFIYKKGELMHMRTHSPANLTGVRWLDKCVDYFGLGLTGFSPGLFGRRHLAAHYNDIGILSKIFSKLNISFDRVPASFYLRPHLLVKYLLDKPFLQEEKLNRKLLLIETVAFYLYLAILLTELYFGSYFLLVFHLIPGVWLASSQFASAVLVHSSSDPQNSWEANGLMNYRTAKGLFKVPLWFYSLFNNGFLENHGIHHAYPQVPLEIINQDFNRYHTYILEHYQNVRYNSVMAQKVQAHLLERLPAPNVLDYGVAFCLSVISMMLMSLTIMGLPVPPGIIELMLVDYRIYFVSTPAERLQNKINYLDSIDFQAQCEAVEKPTTYLKWMLRRYNSWKKYVAAHPISQRA